jgi:hypothetical protein
MFNLFTQLANDEAGFIVSAELVLVATIGVLSMIVGLAGNVNQELEDLGSAFGSINQSFEYSLPRSCGKAHMHGSSFYDTADFCDDDCDLSMNGAQSER